MSEEIKVKLWMPVTKDPKTGELFAVLSDTSIDRDDEAMDKKLLHEWAKNKSLKALANHQNSMQTWVGGWTNLKVVEKGKKAALFAKPWFFSEKSNPLAAQIKNQVEEALEHGENPGISIGAIIKGFDKRTVDGKENIRVYTEGEIVEATWVPIQSNRTATYGHIAKQFDMTSFKDNSGGIQMDKEFTKEDIEKKTEEVRSEFKSEIETKDSDITKHLKTIKEMEDKADTMKKELDTAKESLDKSEKSLDDSEKKVKEKEADVEKAKKTAIEKQQYADQHGFDNEQMSEDDVNKAFESGKLPIIQME